VLAHVAESVMVYGPDKRISFLSRRARDVFGLPEGLDLSQRPFTLDDLARCGCESEPLGHLMQGMEKTKGMAFRLFIKPFMDAWTWDEDRIDRCCTHVIRPDGKLDSFCRYYSGFPDTKQAP
jgi:hypothetical protein